MKETKVYVDGELLKYTDLSLCCTKDFDNKFYTNNYSLIDNEEYFEASFEDIKTHDRELVKEVCEKIRENIEARNINELDIINRLAVFLDEIEKEFEK